jgi:hypothetical protein
MDDDIIKTAIDIMTPVMESSVVLAGHYAKSCGRDCVTARDVAYSMRYCARNLTGKHIGTLFPEIYDDDSEWETDSEQDVSDADAVLEEEFTRYEGSDELMNSVNEAFDTWDDWVPQSPAEDMLKNAIEKSNSHV